MAMLPWLLGLFLNAHAAISFGARTQIWPFLFADAVSDGPAPSADEKTKSEVAVGNLDRYAELGATWNIVDVWQDVDGPDGFRRLERVVAEHERRGIRVALRILERPEIYDDIRGGGTSAARALGEYGQWMRQIARKFGTRVRYYMISNEADHDIGFNRTSYRRFRPVTVEEYRELLRTAYETIKAVDARLKVADDGASSWSLCLAVMDDLTFSGSPGDALAFWRAMAYESPDKGERTVIGLARMLSSADSRHRIEFVRRSTAELTPYRDVYQLHHYFGPDVLPDILGWIRSQLGQAGAEQPILAAEVGYTTPAKMGTAWDGRPMNVADIARYSETDHGTSIAKVVATLGGSGVQDILYWQMRFHVFHSPDVPLFPASGSRDGFQPGYPARVFKFVAGELSGASAVASTTELRDGNLVEYRFRREADFSTLWAPGGTTATFPPSLRSRIARMSDVVGTPVNPDQWDGRVGAAPIFVYWQPQPAAQ